MVYKVEVQQGQNNYKREIQLDIRGKSRSRWLFVHVSELQNVGSEVNNHWGSVNLLPISRLSIAAPNIQPTPAELLRSPTIEVVYSGFKNNTRWLLLRCSSLHKGVAFAWEPSTVTTTFGKRNEKCLAEYNTTQVSAQFTCITTRDTDNASAVYQDGKFTTKKTWRISPLL